MSNRSIQLKLKRMLDLKWKIKLGVHLIIYGQSDYGGVRFV